MSDYAAAMASAIEVRKNFGLRLAAARAGKKLTQQDVADRFSVNKATVSAWETGRGIPDALVLRALAKLYDVSADALLWAESLTPAAMRIAAGYDDLKDDQRKKFDNMWLGFYASAATDAQVEAAYATPPDDDVSPKGVVRIDPDVTGSKNTGGRSKLGDLEELPDTRGTGKQRR